MCGPWAIPSSPTALGRTSGPMERGRSCKCRLSRKSRFKGDSPAPAKRCHHAVRNVPAFHPFRPLAFEGACLQSFLAGLFAIIRKLRPAGRLPKRLNNNVFRNDGVVGSSPPSGTNFAHRLSGGQPSTKIPETCRGHVEEGHRALNDAERQFKAGQRLRPTQSNECSQSSRA